ncbi:MAG: helix-turn-helix transcriptional regulator [Dehalococcoidales bacterium]|jgi:transcriptional regulator with XRE-family HTH domain
MQKDSRLKNIRLRLNLSKAAFSRAANLDPKTYSDVEAGNKPGNEITREKIKQTVNRLINERFKETSLKDNELFEERL